jgi:hypothetical protein
MDGTEDCVKWSKPNTETHVPYVLLHMLTLKVSISYKLRVEWWLVEVDNSQGKWGIARGWSLYSKL